MSTIYVFDQELSDIGTFADADILLAHDASAGLKKYGTVAQLRAALGAVVSTTATTLTVTAASHAGKTIVVNTAAPIAITLPQATGTGNRYRFYMGVAATGTTSTIKVANATDVIQGGVAVFDTSATDITAIAFSASSADDTITMDGTTRAGTIGTVIDIEDVKTGYFSVFMRGAATGSYATPFSATVS